MKTLALAAALAGAALVVMHAQSHPAQPAFANVRAYVAKWQPPALLVWTSEAQIVLKTNA